MTAAHAGRRPPVRSVALAASGWLALLASFMPPSPPVRAVVVAAFLGWAPGAVLIRLWPRADRLERVTVTVMLSVCTTVLVTEAQTLAGLWAPRGSIAILALLTSAGALLIPPRQVRADGGAR